ncbi:IclR family transcriptional regulator [Salinarchaeum laminariae]|uniref:IclR family transcriptional regulator n=1 Tax=Salinarchaeum laminariae TaxID=869888 RepID=UPI0020BF02C4|nr:IclR family transcriptional regulator [Salinarchaeum laminariae]
MGQSSTGNSIGSLERAFDIIALLRERGSLTLTEIAEELGVPTSTVHVYLKTLEKGGFVTVEDRQYRNSLKFLEIGGQVRQQLDIYRAAAPVLTDIAGITGERAGLGVEESGKRVLIGAEDGRGAVSDNIPIGEFTELHWTGLGKCLLAHLPHERRESIITDNDLPRATENTITDPGRLREELSTIRERGFAVEDEERRDGIRSVDVPILTPEGEIIAAIGVTGPVNRFGAEQLSQYISLLQDKANEIKLKTVYY